MSVGARERRSGGALCLRANPHPNPRHEAYATGAIMAQAQEGEGAHDARPTGRPYHHQRRTRMPCGAEYRVSLPQRESAHDARPTGKAIPPSTPYAHALRRGVTCRFATERRRARCAPDGKAVPPSTPYAHALRRRIPRRFATERRRARCAPYGEGHTTINAVCTCLAGHKNVSVCHEASATGVARATAFITGPGAAPQRGSAEGGRPPSAAGHGGAKPPKALAGEMGGAQAPKALAGARSAASTSASAGGGLPWRYHRRILRCGSA